MNNLSVLRGPYIQNSLILHMIEQKLIQTTCNQASLEKNSVNWQDVQGLSWLFYEE